MKVKHNVSEEEAKKRSNKEIAAMMMSIHNRNAKIYRFKYQDEVKTLAEWCELFNLEISLVYNRIFMLGWNITQALNTKPGKTKVTRGRPRKISTLTKEEFEPYFYLDDEIKISKEKFDDNYLAYEGKLKIVSGQFTYEVYHDDYGIVADNILFEKNVYRWNCYNGFESPDLTVTVALINAIVN